MATLEEAEIERLTRSLDNEMAEHERTVMQRDRLHAALQKIATISRDYGPTLRGEGYFVCGNIAKDALEQIDNGEKK